MTFDGEWNSVLLLLPQCRHWMARRRHSTRPITLQRYFRLVTEPIR